MTLFGTIARFFHSIERRFASLHEWEWYWRHRDDAVLVQSRWKDGEWVPYVAHDPERQTKRNDEDRYAIMTLEEAREHGFGVCSSCYFEHTYEPHPY